MTSAHPAAPQRRTFVPRPLVLALAACLPLWPAQAQTPPAVLPSGLSVASGQASVSTAGQRMTVVNSPQAILNWNSFSIGATHSVHFQQADAASQVLNRVTGNDPSQILGSLSSNGRVWLLNPNGVLFGQGARVDVAALVASTLRLNDADWLGGRYRFSAAGPDAGVVNQGELRSAFGGSVALLGGTVANGGLVQAPGGQIVLAAGRSVELVDTGAPNLGVRVTAPAGQALNLGELHATGGRIDIHAAAVNQQGLVSADSLSTGPGGQVWIKASQSLELGAASRTSADGASGGQVLLDGGEGRATVQGHVSAQGSAGTGGQVVVLGTEVALSGAARIDASGRSGGGEVLVGGGEQGRDARFANARAVNFGRQASISADALASGDGGRIVLWSDQATRAYGSLSVRGGAAGGDGGFIETSGGWLDARPALVATSAPRGQPGRWLLDPHDIFITDGIANDGFNASFTATADSATIDSATITGALGAGTNVTISTGGSGGSGGNQAGNITVYGAQIVTAAAQPGSLTLIADGSIQIDDSNIGTSNGPMSVTLLAGRAGQGSIAIGTQSSGTTTISTSGLDFGGSGGAAGARDIVLSGFATGSAPDGQSFTGAVKIGGTAVDLRNAALKAGSGSVSVNGIARGGVSSFGAGVAIDQTTLSGATVNVTGQSQIGQGVSLQGDSLLQATDGASVRGLGSFEGVSLFDSRIVSTGAGGVLVRGHSSGGDYGVSAEMSYFFTNPMLQALGGGGITVQASNSGNDSMPALSATGGGGGYAQPFADAGTGGTITLQVVGTGRDMVLSGVGLSGGPALLEGAGTLSLINDSTISAQGPVVLAANAIDLGLGVQVASTAPGDAIVLAGPQGTALSNLSNTPGAGALSATGGRWIIYFDDPDSPSFAPNNLAFDFKRYGSAYGGWSGDAGNGFVFAAQRFATVDGSVATRTYDGSTAATLVSASVDGLMPNEFGSLNAGATVAFVDKEAGTGKPATFTSPEPFSFVEDLYGKPVYGYTLVGALVGTVNPAPLLGTPVADSKVYDGNTSAPVGLALSGLVAGETLNVIATGSFNNKNVGNAKPVTASFELQDGSQGGRASNYVLSLAPNQPPLVADITPRPLSLGGVTVADKVYDATTQATLSGTPVLDLVPGDQVQVIGVLSASFADKNVGVAKPVQVGGLSLSGADAGNYSVSAAGGLSASITPRNVDIVGLSAADKVYDATTTATVSGTALLQLLPGDVVTLAGTLAGRFEDKNVGNDKPVLLSGLSLGGADAGNYRFAPVSGLVADITPRVLTINGLSADDKVYDASTAVTLRGSASITPLPGDAVTLAGLVGRFADKHVGSDKPVLFASQSLVGADAGNYELQALDLRASITPRAVSVPALAAQDKVYDASAVATLTGQSSLTSLAGDDVRLSPALAARFADKNVGQARAVSLAGYALDGADAGNYTLQPAPALQASITPRDVAVGGLSALDKVYDASAAAQLTGTARLNALAGDALALQGTPSASFPDKGVGLDRPVSVSGLTLAGADAGNYRLQPVAGLSADITPRPLALAGLSVPDKVYDGGVLATLNGSASVPGLPGDAVTLQGSGTARFADKHVGIAKAVIVSGYSLSGADAANYSLQPLGGLSASITPLALSLSGLAALDKVYDGGTLATLSGSARITALAGDDVALQGAAQGRFADKNVGAAKAVSVQGLSLAGADAGNYSLQSPPGLVATITPLAVSVGGVSALDKVYDSLNAATLTGSARAPTLAGDAVTLDGSAAVASFADRHVGQGKPVTVGGFRLAGVDAGNYSLAQPTGLSAGITPATLLYVAAEEVRALGEPIVGLGGTVTGLLGPDTLASATSGSLVFQTSVTQGAPQGRYPVAGSGLSATDYVLAQAPGNAQALSIVDFRGVTSSLPPAPPPGTAPGVSGGGMPGLLRGAPGITVSGMLDLASATPPLGGSSGRGKTVAAGSAPPLGSGDFGVVRLGALTPPELQGLLDRRDQIMRYLLSDAVALLEKNPALADLRECRTLQEAEQGVCLITAEIKQRQSAAVVAPDMPAVAPTVPTAPRPAAPEVATGPAAPAPAAAAVPPPSSTQAAAPQPAPAAAATPLLASAPPTLPQLNLLSAKRKVRSAALPQIERKVALVVGVDRYQDASIPSLNNAVRDARAVAQVFENQLGYETVVLDNATRPALVAALNRLALALGPRDSVVIYYAGHGELVEATQLGYWLLADSVAKQPESWLSNADISRLVAQIGASQVALVSDSCYSGSLAAEERIRAAGVPPSPQDILQRKSVVVMSSGGNEPVFDEGKDGHSPFAYNLMNTLRGLSNWQAGGNVFERVRFAVARSLPQRPQYSASRAAGHQSGGDYLFEQRQLDAAP